MEFDIQISLSFQSDALGYSHGSGYLYPLILRPQACMSLLGRTSRKYRAKEPCEMS